MSRDRKTLPARTGNGQASAATPVPGPRHRWPAWLRLPAIVAGVYLAGCGVLGLALPPLLEHWALPAASQTIGREITAGQIRFNPFTLRLTAADIAVAGTGAPEAAAPPFVAIGGLDVDLSIRSLRHLAPVIESLKVDRPTVRIRRDADGRFDFNDIVDRIAALPARPETDPPAEPARFAVNNIALTGGQVHVDDRHLDQVHAVEALTLGLPFISNLPDDIEINVEPALAATIDGSPLTLSGQTLPFHDSHRTTLDVNLRDLVLAPWLKLIPGPLGFTLPEGRLSTALKLGFIREKAANRLAIEGTVRVDDLAIDAGKDGRLLALRQLDVDIGTLEPLIGQYRIAGITIDGLDATLLREANGRLPIVSAFAPPPEAQPRAAGTAGANRNGNAAGTTRPATPVAPATVWSVASTTVRNARFTWTDRTTTPAIALRHDAVTLDIGPIGNRQQQAAPLTFTLRQGEGGQLAWKGELDLAKHRAAGQVDARVAAVAPYLPYFADSLGAKLGTGPIRLATRFETGWSDDFTLQLHDGSAAIEKLQLTLADDKEPAVQLGEVAVDGLALDLARADVAIARARLAGADIRVTRDARGAINLERIAAASSAASPSAAPPPAPPPATTATASKDGPSWAVAIARIELDDNRVRWQDLTAPSRVTIPVSGLAGTVEQIGTRLAAPSRIDLRATVGRRGQLTAKGSVTAAPLATDLNLQLRSIAIAPFDPYVEELLSVGLREGSVSGQGRLRYGADRLRFAGRVGVDGLKATERRNASELLRWDSLALTDIDVDIAAGGTGRTKRADQVSIGNIALADFMARVELSAEGRFNLQDIVQRSEPTPGQTANSGPATAGAPAGAATASGPPMHIRLGGIRLDRGASTFTDYFIKPNYSVNLSDLGGTISAMASDAAEAADVQLDGRIDGDAPIRISGKLNPLGPTLHTDISASAKGIDLPTFTPYSGKYAGYAIEKGKLSLDVHYRIENEQLAATNRLFLDQLTFGEKVDSPDAVDLPIQFAIGLLKNRAGEIDVSLPISGSLNDPEFSIGGIVWKAVLNLLTRIVTAPFSALASAFGGTDEALSFVEFKPGSADLTGDSSKRLEIIAKALHERPALKLEIAGRMNPAAERDAFGAARLQERLQALYNDGRRRGRRGGPDAPAAVPDSERPALLARLAETLALPAPDSKAQAADAEKASAAKAATTAATDPTAALEHRLVLALAADGEAQRALATRRSQVARDRLTASGIVGERIFLLAPRVGAAGGKDGQKPVCQQSCAEFSLR